MQFDISSLRLRAICLIAYSSIPLWICGCNSDTYLPLKVGSQWHYTLQTEMDEAPVENHLDFSMDRSFHFQGGKTYVHRSESGVEYFLQQRADGIYRIASRVDTEEQSTLEPQAIMVLPTPVKLGAQWSAPTVPFLLRRSAEFPRELKYRHSAVMHYQVKALDESVDVPAGHFDHCAKVQGQASLRFFIDPVKGVGDEPLQSTEWYCQGVGLVRFDRAEIVDSSFVSGGSVSYVLSSYSR